MNPNQMINRVMLLALAPFLGLFLFLLMTPQHVALPPIAIPELNRFDLKQQLETMLGKLDLTYRDAAETKVTIERYYDIYAKSAADMASMVSTSTAAAKQPGIIFDNRFASRLGAKPSRSTATNNIDIKLYYFKDPNYHGYALKVDLKSDQAMRMVLGQDKVGGTETTLSAAKRYGALAGINAGGFADDAKTGKRYPLSTTVLDGNYVHGGFQPSFENLTFIGLSRDRKLIGGQFSRQEELDKLNPSFGASFVPVLLKNGMKLPLPQKWQGTRAPRTVVGSFSNHQLVFLVTDGYNKGNGAGATLEEMQNKLAALGIKDAYNLDGGGSSSLIYNNQVINKPSDGKLRTLPTHFLFFK